MVLQNIFVGMLTVLCIAAAIVAYYLENGNPFSKEDSEEHKRDDASEVEKG